MSIVKEYREDSWRLIAVYFSAIVFLGVGALLRGGFWFVGGVGGGISLSIAVYSTIIGRVKIRLTDIGIEHKTFGVMIPYNAIHDVRLSIPLARPDSSTNDCLWIKVDPSVITSFGILASIAMVKRQDGSTWLPVGIVGQPECKGSLFAELSNRVKLPEVESPSVTQRLSHPVIPLSKWKHDSNHPVKVHNKPETVHRDNEPVDPLNDPVSARTDWTPLRNSGANFKTRVLVAVGTNRVEFRASRGEKGFALTFLIYGLFMLGVLLLAPGKVKKGDWGISFAIHLIFPIVGGCLLYFMTTPIVFDKERGIFRKGRKMADAFVGLDKIHALQLVSVYISGSRSFYSHELNLVLETGARINVVDSGDGTQLRKDAETLSAFLGKPLWNEEGWRKQNTPDSPVNEEMRQTLSDLLSQVRDGFRIMGQPGSGKPVKSAPIATKARRGADLPG